MGREVRRVSADWNHPKKDGHFVPLHGQDCYKSVSADWDEGEEKWKKGLLNNYWEKEKWVAIPDGLYVGCSYDEHAGPRPLEEDFMPEWTEEQVTHYQMYETTTEGTPISPAMETPEELAKWLVDNGASAFGDMKADYESWLRVCNGGFALSAVLASGSFESGVVGLG